MFSRVECAGLETSFGKGLRRLGLSATSRRQRSSAWPWVRRRNYSRTEARPCGDSPLIALEMMLDAYGVSDVNWRDAIAKEPHSAISETPRYVGRAIALLAADP